MRPRSSLFLLTVLVLAATALITGTTGSKLHHDGDMIVIDNGLFDESESSPTPALPEVSGQEKIDTMVRALKHLPKEELMRLGVDLDIAILEDSPEAEKLQKAWLFRQAELKEAMKSLMDPPEHMSNLTAQLIDTSLGTDDKVQILTDLESLLEDIDNAKDFYTIGLWPSLASMLQPHHDIRIRTQAAWAIGTAVKNSYDYQLWVLDTVSTTLNGIPLKALGLIPELKHVPEATLDPLLAENGLTVNSTVLELLLNCLSGDVPSSSSPSSAEELEHFNNLSKRALYALASALRGNIDVQNTLHLARPAHHVTSNEDGGIDGTSNTGVWLFDRLQYLAQQSPSDVFPDTVRKVWSLSTDLLQERTFIRAELEQLVSSGVMDVNSDDMAALREGLFLGDVLSQSHSWINTAVNVFSSYCNMLQEKIQASASFSDIIQSGGSSSSSIELKAITQDIINIRATISNVVGTLEEIVTAVSSNGSSVSSSTSNTMSNKLLSSEHVLKLSKGLSVLSTLEGDSYEELVRRGESLLVSMQTVVNILGTAR